MASETCGCIYVIDCFDTEDLYIGSTNNIHKRKICHKTRCTNSSNNFYNLNIYQTIRKYGGWKNWAMFPIEDQIPLEELKKREQFYIDTLKPSLNERNASANKEEERKKKIEKIKCECGLFSVRSSLARHTKSKKHIKLMENKISVKVI